MVTPMQSAMAAELSAPTRFTVPTGKDGTELLGVNWPHRDATDPKKARRVVKAFLLHYGQGKSLLEMARIHNGGPCGDKKKATLPYARKILADGSLPSGLHAPQSSPLFIH